LPVKVKQQQWTGPGQNGSAMKILMVDNDRSFLRSLDIVLGRNGHQVLAFADPREAAGFICSQPVEDIDAVLVDYLMPELTGIQLIRTVHGHLPDRCRIVLLTGHAEDIPDEELAQTRIDVLCTKPLDVAELLEVIEGNRLQERLSLEVVRERGQRAVRAQ